VPFFLVTAITKLRVKFSLVTDLQDLLPKDEVNKNKPEIGS